MLTIVFIDLIKAFDSVSHAGLCKLLDHVGFPGMLINIMRSFHNGMKAHVIDSGWESAPFDVHNGIKQGCVFASLMFSLIMAAVNYDAFHDCDKGVIVNFHYDNSIFNL